MNRIGILASSLTVLVAAFASGWLITRLTRAPSPMAIDPPLEAAPSATVPADPLAHLLPDLASADPTVHARGTATLASATTLQRDTLRVLAATAPAPFRDELTRRLAELDEQAAVDPPPISLSVKDASAEALATALSKSLGKPFDFFPPPANADALFTLDAQNQPFWNIINDLNRQHAIAVDMGLLSNRQRGLVLRMDQPMPELHPFHGFVVFAKAFGPPNILGAPPPAPDELTLNYAIAADPRIWVTSLAIFPHEVTVDGAPMPMLNIYHGLMQFQAHYNLCNTALTVRMSDKFAGKTALIHAQHHFTVVSKPQTVTIEDAEKHIGETFNVGLESLTLSSRSTFSASRLSYTLVTTNRDARADIDLFDSTGTLIQHNNYFQNNGVTLSGNFQPPFKLQITAPAKTTDVIVPVDLHIPLP